MRRLTTAGLRGRKELGETAKWRGSVRDISAKGREWM